MEDLVKYTYIYILLSYGEYNLHFGKRYAEAPYI
jgi:hypothetical protein